MKSRVVIGEIISSVHSTNILKHVSAGNVNISIYGEDDHLVPTISDDGIGFDEKTPRNNKFATGLEFIQRRVEYLNGEPNINSRRY